jgi:hypothetical protein
MLQLINAACKKAGLILNIVMENFAWCMECTLLDLT